MDEIRQKADIPADAVLVKQSETKRYFTYVFKHIMGNFTVDGDRIAVKVNKSTSEVIISERKWNTPPLPRLIRPLPIEVEGVLIDPDDPFYIWDEKPLKYHPCYFVWKENQLTIVDAVTRRTIGHGIPPPDKAFSMSGANWKAHMENAKNWFIKMGFDTTSLHYTDMEYPGELIKSKLRDPRTKCVYQIAHGNSQWSGLITAGDVRECLVDRDKMSFAFVGHCGGMCGESGFSDAYRKGSKEDTVAVGYCGMASVACQAAWSRSRSWQDKLFQYIHDGMTCGDAFEEAIADYPECEGCMVFHGDENFILKSGGDMPEISFGVTIEMKPKQGGNGEKLYAVRVTVVKEDTDDGLAGVGALMAGEHRITDVNGRCTFHNTLPGTYIIAASHVNYEDTTKQITLPA